METRTVRQLVCPAEVIAPLPPRAAMPDNPLIEASADVLAWIGARFAREDMLDQRFEDAKAQCHG